MASQIFKFPGFFEREIDQSAEQQAAIGVPAGVVGTSERGPAFVPISVGSFGDFKSKFGDLNPKHAAIYAVSQHLQYQNALTFMRVLGAGSNTTSTHIENTRIQGVVNNAGFKISASLSPDSSGDHTGAHGAVQFLLARHVVTGAEAFGQAGFTNNDSLFTTGSGTEAFLVRGVIFAASGARVQVMNHNESWATGLDDSATANSSTGKFKIVISSSEGTSFASDEGKSGIRIFTASLNPSDDDYFAKLLNTNPEKFSEFKHYVYADFAVDNEIASVGTGTGDIVIASGSSNTSANSGDTNLPFLNAFGRFDTRFQTAKTPSFISQPFGTTEYDLFHFESLDDGEFPNKKVKISIAGLRRSTNPRDKFGTFSVLVRSFNDTDTDPVILEQYNNVNLNPNSDSYIGKAIGDAKVYFNFDAEDEDDRRLMVSGKYRNRSKYVRIVVSDIVERGMIPNESLPFGFRGVEAPSFNSRLVDRSGSLAGFSDIKRLAGQLGAGTNDEILAALVPPLPMRFKVTRGAVSTDAGKLEGAPGNLETVDARYYWGVKIERTKNVINQNVFDETNKLVESYTQLNGISQLDVLVTGSGNKDQLHNNKFTLSRVALGNSSISDVTSSISAHMREASYMRNGKPDGTDYKVTDNLGTSRITFASLVNKAEASTFNAFSNFAKFTCILQGGFDGVNILDKNAVMMNDKASSTENRADGTSGNAYSSFKSPGFDFNQNGSSVSNNTVSSYREASKIITDSIASNINLLVVPGQREPLVTDFIMDRVTEYGKALYLMDIPAYDSSSERIFDNETSLQPDPTKSGILFEGRTLDTDATAPYFPDFVMDDTVNGRRVTVPASVAAVSAFAFNDKVSYPWFAPAGFNRASLDFVKRTTVKINLAEREALFDININPIIKFPGEGYVINSQNTLDATDGSAMQSVNVARMVLDVKRQIVDIGNRFIFENITPGLREQLVDRFKPVLSIVQNRAGLKKFEIICDERNNTDSDVNNNKINCKILLYPIRAVEFVAIDFIITRSGAQFV
jgi:hypothetical protein